MLLFLITISCRIPSAVSFYAFSSLTVLFPFRNAAVLRFQFNYFFVIYLHFNIIIKQLQNNCNCFLSTKTDISSLLVCGAVLNHSISGKAALTPRLFLPQVPHSPFSLSFSSLLEIAFTLYAKTPSIDISTPFSEAVKLSLSVGMKTEALCAFPFSPHCLPISP